MERPSSRASQDLFGSKNTVTGSTGSGLARPPSATRVSTASMRAPGTASRTARPGIGIQSWNTSSPFVPQVADRPVTQQGMAGLKTASGVGRQVADKTYYLAQLRQKRFELIEVTSQLQAELDSSGQDLAKRQQLEMQVDTASKEVQQLQGQLSDLNAVLSNHVASTKLESLHDQHAKMLASNHAERQRVDAVYANRAAKQRQTKEVQSAAEQIQKQLEQKVHEMSIEQQQEYYNLQDTRQQLQATQQRLEAELQNLATQVSTAEIKLAAEPAEQRALALQQQVDGLAKRKAELQAEDQRPSLGPQDQRAALLAQIKADNEACELASQRAKQATEAVRQMERQANTAQPVSPLSGGQERYEELLQQEKAMTAFMDSFPTSRAGKLAELEGIQMAGTARQNPFGRTSNPDVPPLVFDESQATPTQQAEMKKVKGLQEKLGTELTSLSQRMADLQVQGQKYEVVDGAKDQARQQTSTLEMQHLQAKQSLQAAEAAVREQTQLLERQREALGQSAELLQIAKLEEDISRTQEANSRLSQVIKSRVAEANYSVLVDDVLRLVTELNGELKQAAML
ncbi:TPA: hypothetical protein ACH3X2_002738 [Trebouxia sp. C0005]